MKTLTHENHLKKKSTTIKLSKTNQHLPKHIDKNQANQASRETERERERVSYRENALPREQVKQWEIVLRPLPCEKHTTKRIVFI